MEEVWLLDRCRSADEREVGAQAVLGRVDLESERVERLDHLDLDRSDLVGVGSIGRRPPRGVHVDLPTVDASTVDHHAERRVADVAVRVQPHRGGEVQAGVAGVSVEEVAVVVVQVGRRRLGDRT